jgi:hypothetical protein
MKWTENFYVRRFVIAFLVFLIIMMTVFLIILVDQYLARFD